MSDKINNMKNSPAKISSPKTGFFATLIGEVKEMILHPMKLLPTFILSGIWLIFSILSTIGVNIPAFRFLYTLTYSNGGMFGGFFGAVGGIFGKAVFAAVINTIVLSLCAKKNPFANAAKSLKDIFSKAAFSGLSAVSPFLIGAGFGLVLYWLFNITSSPVNCAVAVVGAVGAFSAIGKKNGIITSLIFSVAGKLSKGKTPSQTVVNRAITGFSAGFAIGLPLTFARFGWLIILVGTVILAVGIVFAFIGKNGIKKTTAAAMLLLMIGATVFPVLTVNTSAFVLPEGFVDPAETLDFSSGICNSLYGVENTDAVIFDSVGADSRLARDLLTGELRGCGEYELMKTIPSFTLDPLTVYRNEKNDAVSATGKASFFHDGKESGWEDYEYNFSFTYDLELYNFNFTDSQIFVDVRGTESYSYGVKGPSGSYESDSKTIEIDDKEKSLYAYTDSDTGELKMTISVDDGLDGLILVYTVEGILPAAGSVSAGVPGDVSDDAPEKVPDGDPDVMPYRGRLTYTNGRVNKYGQPFPDLMDFDEDGAITWLDLSIQKELSHDPDWLDRPVSKTLGVFLAILTGLFGTGGSIIGGALGSIFGNAASAAAESGASITDGISSDGDEEKKEDLGPYIKRDADGDLNVKDPATGEERIYTSNGDGTYTNPLTGATYTEDELKNSLESRAENADLIRQDKAAADEAVKEQREENQDKSQITKELEAEEAARIEKENREAAKNKYKEKLSDKYGVYSGDDDLYAKIGEKQGKAEIERYEQTEIEKELHNKQEYVENVKKGADVAIDIYAEVDPTGTGKKFKDGYTVATAAASNAGDVMAGYKTVGGAIAQTAVDSSVELLKNHSNGATQKFASNIMGDSVKAMSDTYMKGGSVEDIRQAGEGAAIQGGINATVDVAFDAFGGKANEKLGLTGDKVVGKIMGEKVTKEMTGKGAGVVANTMVKAGLTIKDSDEEALEKLQKANEQAEADANAEAINRFKEAQKEWAEHKKEEE